MLIDNRLFHIHIPRTAGRYVREVLQNNGYNITHAEPTIKNEGIEQIHLHYPLYNKYLGVDKFPHFTIVRIIFLNG